MHISKPQNVCFYISSHRYMCDVYMCLGERTRCCRQANAVCKASHAAILC